MIDYHLREWTVHDYSTTINEICPLLSNVVLKHELMSPNRAALPFAELLERRTDDAAALHHAVSSHPDVSQVAPDDAVIHDDSLNTQKQNMT